MARKSVIKNYIKIILLSLLIIGCSPQKRLNRLIKKHPELTELDTIIVRDTVVVQNYDTTINTIIKLHDTTTVINNERLVLKYFYDTLRETIFHEVDCLGDTVYTEKLITVERAVFRELSWWEKYKDLIYILAVLLLGLVLFKKVSKIAL
tara:strand:+ start:1038 stop:1487 length:450 start_codon:yes stop_codon:yes gene_type:complete